MSTTLLENLQGQLKNIQIKDDEFRKNNFKILELDRFKRIANTISTITTCLIIIGIVTAFLLMYKENKAFTIYKLFSIIFLSFYPGVYGYLILSIPMNKFFEWLAIKLSRINLTEYDRVSKSIHEFVTIKTDIRKQIWQEEARIRKEKERQEEWEKNAPKREEVQKKRDLEREFESQYLTKITDAVDVILNRKITFQDAKQLQLDLEAGFKELENNTCYYFHNRRFYRFRLDRIESLLVKWDGELFPINKPDKINTANSQTIPKQTEPKVEPFSSNYKPIINVPESKTQVQEETKNEKELNFKNKLSDAVSDIEYKLIPQSEAKQLQQELVKEFNSIKIHGLFWNDSDYYFDQFEKITKGITKYEVSPSTDTETKTELTIQKKEVIIDKIPEPKVEPINPKVEPFTPTYKPISEPEIKIKKAWWIPEKETEKLEEPIQPVVTNISSDEKPEDQTSIQNTKTKKSNPWWDPEKVEEPIQAIETKSTDNPNVETELTSPESESEPNQEITFEEVSLQDLLDKRKNKIKQPRTQSQDRQPVKRDFSTINDARQTIGLLGEQYAIEKEIERLHNEGLNKYINDIRHVSLTDDSLGYDILSFNHDGSERYIEVKTTTGNDETPFYISETERIVMDELPNYFIYFIYNFDTRIKKGQLTKIDCNNNIEQNLLISPISYKVTIK